MSFNFYLMRGVRLLLFPLSLLVWGYIVLRNYCYHRGWLKSTTFNLPVICVGNLSVGGTGKSPTIEYLLRLLTPLYATAVVSRGYKRKTSGYLLANSNSTALDIGDEPMQFFIKFPEVAIAVGEERLEAIPLLLQDRPETKVILLDDAFQHRKIQAGYNILLTDYNDPYWHDWYLPTGNLRDTPTSVARASVIIVTKCPDNLNDEQMQEMVNTIAPLPHQQVFFTRIRYGVPYHILSGQAMPLPRNAEVLLVCGIANPAPLKAWLEKEVSAYFMRHFADHHVYNIDDWHEIVDKFNTLDARSRFILTTEKDTVRLLKFGNLLQDYPVAVLPIEHEFLHKGAKPFADGIMAYIAQYYKP